MYDTISDSVRMMKEMSHKIFAQPVLAFAKVNNENNFVKLTKTVTVNLLLIWHSLVV